MQRERTRRGKQRMGMEGEGGKESDRVFFQEMWLE